MASTHSSGRRGATPIEVIACELELEHHLVVGLRDRPGCSQVVQQVRLADHEETIAGNLLQSDLGRILPPGRASGDALGLLGERPLGELLLVTHCAADGTLGRRRRCDPTRIDELVTVGG